MILISEEYLAKCNEEAYVPTLHLSRVKMRCKLQGRIASCGSVFNLELVPDEETSLDILALFVIRYTCADCLRHKTSYTSCLECSGKNNWHTCKIIGTHLTVNTPPVESLL